MKYQVVMTIPLLSSLLFAAPDTYAETLNCKLYVSTSTDLTHKIDLPFAGIQLSANRHTGTCHFEDGRVASKEFVTVQRPVGDGSTGTIKGYSVYSFNDKDSVSLEFDGDWGSKGFNGAYIVIGGTGGYESAKGDGSFKSVSHTLNFNNVFDVTINLAE